MISELVFEADDRSGGDDVIVEAAVGVVGADGPIAEKEGTVIRDPVAETSHGLPSQISPYHDTNLFLIDANSYPRFQGAGPPTVVATGATGAGAVIKELTAPGPSPCLR